MNSQLIQTEHRCSIKFRQVLINVLINYSANIGQTSWGFLITVRHWTIPTLVQTQSMTLYTDDIFTVLCSFLCLTLITFMTLTGRFLNDTRQLFISFVNFTRRIFLRNPLELISLFFSPKFTLFLRGDEGRERPKWERKNR